MRIFHRIDDISDSSYEMSKVLDFFAETVREFVAAVVPNGATMVMAQRLRSFRNCRVYQHGYQHVNRVPYGWCDEFPDSFPRWRIKNLIGVGKHRLEDLMQHEVTGYVPPWNNTGRKTMKVLEELGFEVYSAQKNNTRPFRVNRDIDFDIVSSYEPRIVYRPLDEVLKTIKTLGQGDTEVGVLYHFRNATSEDLSRVFRFVTDLEVWQNEGGKGGPL